MSKFKPYSHKNIEDRIYKYWEKNKTTNFFGGHAQNRTGIKGFAILCVTIPPRGLKLHKKLFKSFIYFNKAKSIPFRFMGI